MARPKKNNADYFTHDADMRNDVKIKALRRKFSHTGYAVWNYLLETLTDSDFFEVEWVEINIELLAADYDVSVEELTEIVDYCVKIGLLQRDGGKLFSQAHQRRFASLLSNRGRKRGSDEQNEDLPVNGEVMAGQNPAETNESGDNGGSLPHSKVKESKRDYNKEELIATSTTPTSRACAGGEYPHSGPSVNPASATPEKGCAEKAPPDPLPEGTYKYIPVAAVGSYLKSSADWFEAFCMNNHLERGYVLTKIDEFARECANRGETVKDKRDCKRHFNNWLRKNRQHHESRTPTNRGFADDLSLDEFDRATRERVARRLASDQTPAMGPDRGGPSEPF